jgi:hypothetical protein
MSRNIFDRLMGAYAVLNGTLDLDQTIPISGLFIAKVTRADGSEEIVTRKNIVVRQGLNRIAYRSASYNNTIATYLCIGTQSAAHSLDSTQAGIGEVGRKIAASQMQSHEWFSCQATWAGNADGLTGVDLETGAMADYPNSSAGSGIIFNAANGLGVTLQASDFLSLTAAIRVGSHNLSQST